MQTESRSLIHLSVYCAVYGFAPHQSLPCVRGGAPQGRRGCLSHLAAASPQGYKGARPLYGQVMAQRPGRTVLPIGAYKSAFFPP